MTISAKHAKTSAVADTNDASLIQPSDWNAEHQLQLAGPAIIGRASSDTGAAQEIGLGSGLKFASGALAADHGSSVTAIPDPTTFKLLAVDANGNPVQMAVSAFLAAMGQAVADLSDAGAIQSSDIITVSRGGVDYRSTAAALKNFVGGTVTPATAYTLTGPSTGTVGVASGNFTVSANGSLSGSVTVTPNDSGAGGAFTPASVTLNASTLSATVTYTASSAGAKTIGATNNGGLSNPASVTYTASAAGATALSMTGPSSGTVSTASGNFTVTANGALSGNVTVTPSDGGAGGSFTPSTITLSSGTLSGTFTYTPSSTGARTVSITNTGSLSNPAGISYTSNANLSATSYTLTGPASGFTGTTSTNFTVQASGTLASPVTVTPSDGGAGGTFAPTSVTLAAGASTSATFTYTPASAGAKTISVANSGGLSNPASLTYTSNAYASAYTLSGPASGFINAASANFTVQVTGTLAAPVTVTPNDGGVGGTFSPASVTLAAGLNTSATFTYTPSSSGARTISTTNSGGLSNPTGVAYTSNGYATTYTLTGPSSGNQDAPSSAFTVTASGVLASSVTVTPGDGGAGGTFSPSTVTLAAGTNTSATFTYTPTTSGARTISATNNGGLSNPAGVNYTSTVSLLSAKFRGTPTTTASYAGNNYAAFPNGSGQLDTFVYYNGNPKDTGTVKFMWGSSPSSPPTKISPAGPVSYLSTAPVNNPNDIQTASRIGGTSFPGNWNAPTAYVWGGPTGPQTRYLWIFTDDNGGSAAVVKDSSGTAPLAFTVNS